MEKCENCKENAVWFNAPQDSVGQWCNKCVPRHCKECNSLEDDNYGRSIKQHSECDRVPCVEIWNLGEQKLGSLKE